MATTAPFIERRRKTDSFLARNTSFLVGLLAIAVFSAITMGVLLFSARQLQQETLSRIDQPVNGHDLPGPRGQVSTRTKYQVTTVLTETPHILGGWVTKLKYEKTEVPFIHTFVKVPELAQFLERYADMQRSGKGFSSAELDRDSAQSLRNSEEAKSGLIKCGPLSATNIPKLAPGIDRIAKGVCRATIPPFDENVNIAIVVVTDVDGSQNSSEIQEIRRSLLQLQIDVFNRDYQGRETWARQTPP